MKNTSVVLLILSSVFFQSAKAGDNENFKLLRLSNLEIKNNDTINEEILDLVNAVVQDSLIIKKREHHKLFPLGWLISTFAGYNWRPVEFKKTKFVGTVERSSRSNSAEFTEHDVNFDLYFNRKKYLWYVFKGYDRQRQLKRQDFRRGKHMRDYNVVPFVRDTNNIDKMRYRLHAELTPPEDYRRQLNELFYPVYHDRNLETHPNFLENRPGMGVYGVFCSDCNHSCHPELHPYEWIWWLNTSDTASSDKVWIVGLFKEGSNRMKNWSIGPKIGKIEIPFSIKKSGSKKITIHPLTFGKLINGGNLAFLPDKASHKLDFSNKSFAVGDENRINVEVLSPLLHDGVQFWFDRVTEDKETGYINGYINFAIAAEELFTFRMKVSE